MLPSSTEILGLFTPWPNLSVRADAIEHASTRAREAKIRVDSGAVYRVDRVHVRLDEGSTVYHENGWVDAWGVATRSGVLMYADENGEAYPEYRPPAEVFSPKSLASLHGVPFTIDHPTDLVDSMNARDLTHGWVLRVVADGDLVRVQVRIATEDAKAVLDRGIVELSCGYTAIMVEGAGVTPEGEAFKATQTEIIYNHLALVSKARAGAIARMHLDCALRIGNTMKKGTITTDTGTTVIEDAKALAHLALLIPGAKTAHDAFEKVRAAGQRLDLKTGTIAVSMGEEEPTTLVLPLEMVSTMLGFLGVGEPAAPAEAMPEEASNVPGAEDTAGGDPEEELDDEGEGGENESAEEMAPPKKKTFDGRAIVTAFDAIQASAPKSPKADADEQALAEARNILGDSFDPSADIEKTRADAVAKVLPELAREATGFAIVADCSEVPARKADAKAKLSRMFDHAVSVHKSEAMRIDGNVAGALLGTKKDGTRDPIRETAESRADKAREKMIERRASFDVDSFNAGATPSV